MDSLTEEIERIFREEQEENQCCEEDEMESGHYKAITCLLNIMLLTISVFGPLFAVIMIGSFLKKAGKRLLMMKKYRDKNP